MKVGPDQFEQSTQIATKFDSRDMGALDRSDVSQAVIDGRFAKAAPESTRPMVRGFVRDVVDEVAKRIGVHPADRVELTVFHDDATTERDWELRAIERSAKTGALLEPAIARRMLTAVKRAGAAGNPGDAEILRQLESYLRGRGKA